MRWHVLTGEYPPDMGGVARFTATVCEGLASRGVDVHVWVPREAGGREPADLAGITVHALEDRFARQSRRTLRGALRPKDVVLLQYVPNALGRRGANVRFCGWLLTQAARGRDVRVLFHEPFFYFSKQSVRRNALAAVQRVMAGLLLRASSVVYVSTPSWEPLLRPYAPRNSRFVWVPVPSAFPLPADSRGLKNGRRRAPDQIVVGHFSSYPRDVREPLGSIVKDVLSGHPESLVLCIGRGSEEFVKSVGAAEVDGRVRVHATGALEADLASRAIQSCDLFVQPYPDGMTVRRTSLTTLLAHGAAVVTTTGAYTEPIWTRDGDVVAAAPAGNRTAIGAELGRLIGNRDRRRALAARAEEFYSRHFGPTHAVDALAHKGMAPLPVVVGAHASGRPGVGARHDAFARGLRSFTGARLFDIQFAQDATPPPVVHGAERVRTLWQDSIAVSGRGGARKPIVREIFDALALRAVEMNSRYFMYVNADVEVDARALTLIARGMQDVYLFARTDVGAGRPPEVLRSGVDAFAVDVRWWMQNRWRFRPYVLGEPTWDNVYAAIAMCHAPAAVVCDAGLLRHERHERAWSNSPFAEYQQWLAALDAPYFSLWCEYFEQTKAVDESALPQAARQAAERVFRFRPTRQALAIQALRSAKASVRYVLRDGALES